MPENSVLLHQKRGLLKRIAELEAQVADLESYGTAVAHELKNPVGNILAYADDLRVNYDVMQGSDIEMYLDMIQTQSRRVDTIIDELMLLARIGMVDEVEMTRVEMAPIISDLLDQLADKICATDAQIVLPDSWHDAYGYSPWVERIWYNYLTNGLKYGGEPPHLTLGSHHDAQGLTHFWIKDQGQGLSPDQQVLLFQPFPDIVQPGPKSNGLGLTIVRRIAERLNGQVGIESSEGAGSKFYFALPTQGND